MANHTVLRDVTETLRRLLVDNIVASTSVDVTTNSPPRVKLETDHLLNLFLYQISENAFARNNPPMARGPTQLVRAPLPLDLSYMLTPYVSEGRDSIDEHLILGDAMRILYDNPVLGSDQLDGDLRGQGEQIRITLSKMNLEEHTRVWNALQMPYRLSVCYDVRVALVDSHQATETSRVLVQEVRYEQR